MSQRQMISFMEQNSLKLALIESMKSLVKIVFKSKTMKQVIDIPAIAYAITFREAMLKLVMTRTKIYVHLMALLQHAPRFQSKRKKL